MVWKTKKSEPLKPKAVKKVDKTHVRLAELSESVNYLVKVLQEHAEELKQMRSQIDQVRHRMGL